MWSKNGWREEEKNMSDDITFCASECDNKSCFRHPSNIKDPDGLHSFAYLKGTEEWCGKEGSKYAES